MAPHALFHPAAAAAAIVLVASAIAAPSLAANGDFGRFEAPPGFDPPTIQPALTNRAGEPVASAFPLTDEERELRLLARNLLAPPHTEAGGLGFAPTFSFVYAPTALTGSDYVGFIVTGPFRSATARYERLIEDLRNDLTRMGPFFRLARRVADLDGKRERSLPHVRSLAPEELVNARRRIRENITVMTDVHDVLRARADAYRFALERLVISVPSPAAVEAERLCGQLDLRVREIEIVAKAPAPY